MSETLGVATGYHHRQKENAMNSTDILLDLASRPGQALRALASSLTPELLNAHPGDHDNSIAWLLWHTGREIDVQLSMLSGEDEVWTAQDFKTQFDLGELGDGVGYKHSPEDARAIIVSDAQLLIKYVNAALSALIAYIKTLSEDDLSEVIDTSWEPAVTRGARLVSIVDDAAQHVAQAAYIAGMTL